MCAVFTSLGSASVLMVVTLLLVTGAGGEDVTTQQCKNRRGPGRVRQFPEDRGAMGLWLGACHIDEITVDDIVGLPNITTVYLHDNDIAHLELSIFRHVPRLKTLYLNKNKLRALLAFSEHSCPRLTYIDLHDNQLTTLHDARTFSACTHLQKLNLNDNQLRFIHPDVFSSLTELERLNLDYNKLSFIADKTFVNNKKLRELLLHHNRLTFLPQDFASSLKRADGGLDWFTFYDNPWRCACLLELLADVKRAVVRDYDFLHTYDGKQLECAYSVAAPCSRHPPSRPLPPPRAVVGGGR